MSKRARIKLNPDLHLQAVPDTGTDQAPEPDAQVRKGPEVAATPPPAAPADKALSAGTVFKIVLAGLAVVAVVLLFKGRKP